MTPRGVLLANDPGTMLGGNVSYNVGRMAAALRDYPTGNHLLVPANRTAAIVVSLERS